MFASFTSNFSSPMATIVTREGREVVKFPAALILRDMYNQVDAIVFNPDVPASPEPVVYAAPAAAPAPVAVAAAAASQAIPTMAATPRFTYAYGRPSWR